MLSFGKVLVLVVVLNLAHKGQQYNRRIYKNILFIQFYSNKVYTVLNINIL